VEAFWKYVNPRLRVVKCGNLWSSCQSAAQLKSIYSSDKH